MKREFREASRFASITERAKLEILSVRAMELRAFVALATGRFNDALSLFYRARQAYSLCRGRDLDLATEIIRQIAFLEMNLRSAKVRGSHAASDGRTIPGTSFGPVIATSTRMLLMTADSWLYALDGDRLRAFRIAHDAIGVAPTPAWRVRALAAGAAVFEAFGEVGNARIFADEAARIVPSVRWNATTDEERIGLLRLAEVLTAVNPAAAPTVLDRYDGLSSRMDATRVLRDRDADPRLVGWEAYVRGLVARQRGDLDQAGELLRRAADTFGSCGFLWRAALALIELDDTPIDTRGELALERAAVMVRDNFPESFLARRLGSWAWAYVDPVGSKLTPAQRDVLRRLLEGKKAPAISAETNRAHTTVRKHIKDIHAAFGTHSFAELFAECLRRGIASPGVPNAGAPRAVAVR
jgi:DNA-binding CsgD family transcriptional regulator